MFVANKRGTLNPVNIAIWHGGIFGALQKEGECPKAMASRD